MCAAVAGRHVGMHSWEMEDATRCLDWLLGGPFFHRDLLAVALGRVDRDTDADTSFWLRLLSIAVTVSEPLLLTSLWRFLPSLAAAFGCGAVAGRGTVLVAPDGARNLSKPSCIF